MRTNDYVSVLNDKRGLARDQLNLPITRVPIDIQSSMPMRPTHHVGKGPSPKAKTMPMTTTTTTITTTATTPSKTLPPTKHKVAYNSPPHTISSTTKDTNAVQGGDRNTRLGCRCSSRPISSTTQHFFKSAATSSEEGSAKVRETEKKREKRKEQPDQHPFCLCCYYYFLPPTHSHSERHRDTSLSSLAHPRPFLFGQLTCCSTDGWHGCVCA